MNNTATVQDQNVKKVNQYNCPNEHIKDNLRYVEVTDTEATIYMCDTCNHKLAYSVMPMWAIEQDVSTDERTQDEDMGFRAG